MNEQNRQERGQVLVILVIGVIGLLGFAALAIDGGLIMVERRAVQSGADASSLSGGGAVISTMQAEGRAFQNWNCNSSWTNGADSNATNAGIARASTNNYTIDTDISDANGIKTECNTGVDNGVYVDKFFDVETQITNDIDTAFAHFVTGAPVQTTNIAIARVRPQGSFAFGHAIVALNPADCQGNQNGANFMGTAGVEVHGGGVLSYGCWAANGSGLTVTVDGGSNNYLGETDFSPNNANIPVITPHPTHTEITLPDFAALVPEPDCSGLPSTGGTVGSGTINQGQFNRIQVNGGSTLIMNPGLYCISNGFSVNGGGIVTGTEVTIFMVGGDFGTAGNAHVFLTPPDSSPSPEPALPGMLIFMPPSNVGQVNMLGDSGSQFQGTVFAPTSEIEVGGTASLAGFLSTQFIGWDVIVHGDVLMEIWFDDEQSYQYSPSIELLR
jgi:hypothetical protein